MTKSSHSQQPFVCMVRFHLLTMSDTMPHAHFQSRSVLACLLILILIAPAIAEPVKSRKSSLGVAFSEVEGAKVLFANTETRVSDFEAFVRESGYTWSGKAPFPQTGDHPVVNVNIVDALAFCEWLTRVDRSKKVITSDEVYRLPTNAEWDVAAGKMGEEGKESFPWGTQWPPPEKAGNFNAKAISGKDDGFAYTAPVGSFDPAPNGLHDLAGNVWEWAVDSAASKDGFAALRGGAWPYFRKECLLSSYRYSVPASIRKSSVGFRCVLEDKRRNADQLASATQEVREKLGGSGGATQEEIAAMKQKLIQKNTLTDEEKRGASELMKTQQQGRADAAGSDLPGAVVRPSKESNATKVFVNSLGMRFLTLSGGPLMMGEHEVRERDVENWMLAAGLERERKPTAGQTGDHPAANLTWLQARDFCAWLTGRERASKTIPATAVYRLPSDLEWSAAVGLLDEKGGNPEARNLSDKAQYPWGTNWPPPILSANLDAGRIESYADNYPHTAPVRSFKPSAAGFHDLGGNVAEWCEDSWPGSVEDRVIRGGSCLSYAQTDLLSSSRKHLKESGYRADLGFRVVLVMPR